MDATLVPFRDRGKHAAVVFVHGFAGDTAKTWGRFPEFLASDSRVAGWDLFGLGYTTGLRVDIGVGIWSADPNLSIVAKSLRAALALPPFKNRKALAIVAHSMGGLVAQRALVDDAELAKRTSALVLYGTPSGGLVKARFGWFLKRQLENMGVGSDFVTGLRREWSRDFKTLPFLLRVVAGESDQFVPPTSSLEPFADEVQRVVPGNHLTMVKPSEAKARAVELLIDTLTGNGPARGLVDGALVAVELGHFKKAIDALLPEAGGLDDIALVQLALALEAVGRGEEALSLLEQRKTGPTASTNALGVLGGRLKRRWLLTRQRSVWERAHQMYSEGLRRSSQVGSREYSPDQILYHAINLAFLELMIETKASGTPKKALAYAGHAQKAAAAARSARESRGDPPDDHWSLATAGDVSAIEGDLAAATAAYAKARKLAESPRDIDSMYQQALLIAERRFDRNAVEQVERAFGIAPETPASG